MKLKIPLLSLLLTQILFSIPSAAENCFIAQEDGNTLYKSGDCDTEHNPSHTFEIPLSLIAYQEGLMLKVTIPEWLFDLDDDFGQWNLSNNIKYTNSAMDNSYLWNFKIIYTSIGSKKFQNYINAFNYGNNNLSNNEQTTKWLPKDLKISGQQQVDFLAKLAQSKLPINKDAQFLTHNLMYIGKFNRWQLYGKKGDGYLDSNNKKATFSWFVGFAQNNKRNISFAHYLENANSQQAQIQAQEHLKDLLK